MLVDATAVHPPPAVAVTVYVPGDVGAVTVTEAVPVLLDVAVATVVPPIEKTIGTPTQKPAADSVIDAPGSGAALLDESVGVAPGGYVCACAADGATKNRASIATQRLIARFMESSKIQIDPCTVAHSFAE